MKPTEGDDLPEGRELPARPETLRPPAPGPSEQMGRAKTTARRKRVAPPVRDVAPESTTAPSSRPVDKWSSMPPPLLDEPVDVPIDAAAGENAAWPLAVSAPAFDPPTRRRPALDARSDGGRTSRAELVRSPIDALASSLPEPMPPDRAAQIEKLVRELSRCGPESDEPVRLRLLAFGPSVLPTLERWFPGAIWVDLARPHRPLTSARQLSASAITMIAFGEAAVPHITRLLRAPRAEVRLSAALVACDVVRGALVRPLAARLQDDVPAVRNAAMSALRAARALPETRALRAELLSTLVDEEKPLDWRRRAAWMIGQLRDTEAVPQLIGQLAASAEVADAARKALVTLTGRDLGRFRFRWRSWLNRHAADERASWLIEALDQPDAKQRAHVIEELVLLTGLGYDRRHAVTTREQSRELADFYRDALRR